MENVNGNVDKIKKILRYKKQVNDYLNKKANLSDLPRLTS